jgi:hypothetical protein
VLFENALQGGSQAAGLAMAGIALQQRADLLEIDLESDSLLGVPSERFMDALIFSTPSNNFKSMYLLRVKKLSTTQFNGSRFCQNNGRTLNCAQRLVSTETK